MTATTEITILGGERYRVEGDVKQVERTILDAARGSIVSARGSSKPAVESPSGSTPSAS